jgi:hypothetical protein
MECPHCNKEIPGIECSHCGTMVPEESQFCMKCGKSLVGGPEPEYDDEEDFDPEERVLCSDGTCTGIIIDGKCSECGKPPGETD